MPATQIITFTDEEATKVIQPYDDTFMLTLQIANHNVYHILIDTESLVNVLFCLAFNHIRLPLIVLKLANTLFYGFVGCSIQPFNRVELLVTVGSQPT